MKRSVPYAIRRDYVPWAHETRLECSRSLLRESLRSAIAECCAEQGRDPGYSFRDLDSYVRFEEFMSLNGIRLTSKKRASAVDLDMLKAATTCWDPSLLQALVGGLHPQYNDGVDVNSTEELVALKTCLENEGARLKIITALADALKQR